MALNERTETTAVGSVVFSCLGIVENGGKKLDARNEIVMSNGEKSVSIEAAATLTSKWLTFSSTFVLGRIFPGHEMNRGTRDDSVDAKIAQ